MNSLPFGAPAVGLGVLRNEQPRMQSRDTGAHHRTRGSGMRKARAPVVLAWASPAVRWERGWSPGGPWTAHSPFMYVHGFSSRLPNVGLLELPHGVEVSMQSDA